MIEKWKMPNKLFLIWCLIEWDEGLLQTSPFLRLLAGKETH